MTNKIEEPSILEIDEEQKITQYELAVSAAESSPDLVIDKAIKNKMIKAIKQVLDVENGTSYFLMSPKINYITVFQRTPKTTNQTLALHIAEFLIDEQENLGFIKGFELNNSNRAFEIWLGKEVYMLFCSDHAVEQV